MSILLHAIVIAGGVAVGRWLGRVAKRTPELPPHEEREAHELREDGEDRDESPDGASVPPAGDREEPEARKEPEAPRIDWAPFPCALGDVVVRSSDGAEAWLAGAIVLREDG